MNSSPVPTPPGTIRETATIVAINTIAALGDDGASWDIELDKQLPFYDLQTNIKPVLRLWDGKFTQADAQKDAGASLADGVRVHIFESNLSYVEGDYWVLATRGSATLDTDMDPRVVADSVAPLALVRIKGKPWDLRSTFYPASMWNIWDTT